MVDSQVSAVHVGDRLHCEVREQIADTGWATVTVTGDVDGDSHQLLGVVLTRIWQSWPAGVTVDLRAVGVVNAHGLSAVLQAHRTARTQGVSFDVLSTPGPVARSLVLVGLGHLLTADPGEDEPARGWTSAAPLTLVPAVRAPRPWSAPPRTGASAARRRTTARRAVPALLELDQVLAAAVGQDPLGTRRAIVAQVLAGVPAAEHASLTHGSGHRRHPPTTAGSAAATALHHLQQCAGEGPSPACHRSRSQVHVGDLPDDLRWPRLVELAARRGVRSVLSTPLTAAGQLSGVLTVHSRHPGAFDAGARALVADLADRAAPALCAAETRAGLEQALVDRDVVGQAKGVLMVRRGVTAEQAWELLCAAAQQRHTRVVDLAEEVALTGGL